MSRDERRELVSELSEAGMSTRAIAPIVGRSIGTVHSGQQAGVQNLNTSPESPDDGYPDLLPEPDEDEAAEPPKPITGMDGKE